MKDEAVKNNTIQDLIMHVNHCNDVIKQATQDKIKSEEALRILFEHDKDGSTTYNFCDYKVTITTGLSYKINKVKYIDFLKSDDKIDSKFPIVKQIMNFELNKKAIRDLDQFGTPQDKYLKSLFVTTTNKKLHVSIEEKK